MDDVELSDLGVETISSPTTYSLRVLCRVRFELRTGRRSFKSSRFLKPNIVGCHAECSPLSSHIKKSMFSQCALDTQLLSYLGLA